MTIEFREVSEAEASAPRPTAPTRYVAFVERKELLWPGEVVAMSLYCGTRLAWRAVASYLRQSRFRPASR